MDSSDNGCPFIIHCFVGHEVKCPVIIIISSLSRVISFSFPSRRRVIDS